MLTDRSLLAVWGRQLRHEASNYKALCNGSYTLPAFFAYVEFPPCRRKKKDRMIKSANRLISRMLLRTRWRSETSALPCARRRFASKYPEVTGAPPLFKRSYVRPRNLIVTHDRHIRYPQRTQAERQATFIGLQHTRTLRQSGSVPHPAFGHGRTLRASH